MRRIFVFVCLASVVLQSVAFASNLVIKPTTTLAVETSNNSSAADTFKSQVNGNVAARNVSKLDIHSLLYPGNHTKIYAHLMGWFGTSSHMNVGYDSTSSKQVTRQVQDLISRGIDGVIIDWYGQGTTSDLATLQVMKQAEAHPGFTFAIMVDTGAIKSHSCSGCTPQQALVKHLQYIEQTYFDSPAYMRIQGKPVVTNFDIDLTFQIDWKAAAASVASTPVFLFQNNSGFTHPMTSGSYSWVKATATDYGSAYLSSFYKTGKAYTGLQTVGASYKGFNDQLAAWGSNRIMDQRCGQTWLQTFAKINSMFDAGNQLDTLQLVTWNDYEEGTEIESGIDNCVSVSSSINKNSLSWNITGQENTVDHYKIYVSTDSKNLMSLTDANTGSNTLNLCSFSFASGSYQLFVQAVGKPTLRNQMSSPVTYSPQCGTAVTSTGGTSTAQGGSSTTTTSGGASTTSGGTTNSGTSTPSSNAPPAVSAAVIHLQATPSTFKVHLGHSATTSISVSSNSGTVATPIAFSCLNLPVGMACAFSPVVSDKSGAITSMLTVSAGPATSALNHRQHHQSFVYASLFAFGMLGFLGIGQVKRKRIAQGVMVLFVVGAVVLLSSCAGMGSSQVQAGANYTISVAGTAGSVQMPAATMSVSVE